MNERKIQRDARGRFSAVRAEVDHMVGHPVERIEDAAAELEPDGGDVANIPV